MSNKNDDRHERSITRISSLTPPEKTQEAIRQVCRNRLASGNSFIKTSHVMKSLDVEALPQKIASNMNALAERGELTQWQEGVWRITLDSGRGVPQESLSEEDSQ